MSRPRTSALGRWETITQHMRLTDRKDGRRLACIVNNVRDTPFIAMAVETSVAASSSATAVFDDHAHDEIGTFQTLGAALLAAERYARAWKRKSGPAKACPCPPIGRR